MHIYYTFFVYEVPKLRLQQGMRTGLAGASGQEDVMIYHMISVALVLE
jgi:hypothetical protein